MGKYIIKDTDFGWYFTMQDSEGTLVGTSQIFPSAEDRDAAIAEIRTSGNANIQVTTGDMANSKPCPRYEIFPDKTDEFRYRYRDAEREIVITSVNYKSFEEARKSLDCLMAAAANAEAVVE